jgi:myo-inositol-1-phosphate synthase
MRIEERVCCFASEAVKMGPILDGVAPHMADFNSARTVMAMNAPAVDVAEQLRRVRTDVLVCYLPVGSIRAVQYYADSALAAGTAFVNCVPVFIANDRLYAERFASAGLPIFGDDVRSQVGATIIHQRIMELLSERGYKVDNSYQLNFGGNTDFMNMLARDRLAQKKISKTNAVKAKIAANDIGERLHVGPSDYVPHLGDTKVAYIRVEASGFGGAPLSVELRLQVEDSPNSAAVVLDLVRYAAVARAARMGGPIHPACSYYMKSPPLRMSDDEALRELANIIATLPHVDGKLPAS